MNNYKSSFYYSMRTNETYTKTAARIIVPLIMEIINPKSVVDLGCAIGVWLNYFKNNGVENVLGIDGGNIPSNLSYLNKKEFIEIDIEKMPSITQKYDLAMSLEVAEHLSQKSAEQFVDNLTSLSDIVMFSAAIPYQSGEAHINEQWQSYWASKFLERDYIIVDCLRAKLWKKKSAIYAQNMFIYIKQNRLKDYPMLEAEWKKNQNPILDIVHPKVYLPAIKPDHELKYIMSVQKDILKALTYKIKKMIIEKSSGNSNSTFLF